MFGWLFRKEIKNFKEETKIGFIQVKKDMDSVGTWIKHLDNQDKQLLDLLNSLKLDLSYIKEDIDGLRIGLENINEGVQNRQVFKKLPVLDSQTDVENIQKAVQPVVQTDNIYGILKNLSGNEKLIVMTIMNNEMKLSYEDIALLLGKERSTIRGQINSIRQKSEGLIEEIIEKNGKKRVYIPVEIKEKLSKYAKVRVGRGRRQFQDE